MGTNTPKHALMDLRLYLETPWPDPAASLHKPTRTEMLLFFKYYDPAAESLTYVGHLFAPKAARVKDLFVKLRKWAALPDDAPVQCYEEIKWEPSVMVEPLNAASLLYANAQLETGDIIAFQVDGGDADGSKHRFPTVKDFMSYVHNRLLVRGKRGGCRLRVGAAGVDGVGQGSGFVTNVDG